MKFEISVCGISHGPSQWERAFFDPTQPRDPSTDFHETFNVGGLAAWLSGKNVGL